MFWVRIFEDYSKVISQYKAGTLVEADDLAKEILKACAKNTYIEIIDIKKSLVIKTIKKN